MGEAGSGDLHLGAGNLMIGTDAMGAGDVIPGAKKELRVEAVRTDQWENSKGTKSLPGISKK